MRLKVLAFLTLVFATMTYAHAGLISTTIEISHGRDGTLNDTVRREVSAGDEDRFELYSIPNPEATLIYSLDVNDTSFTVDYFPNFLSSGMTSATMHWYSPATGWVPDYTGPVLSSPTHELSNFVINTNLEGWSLDRYRVSVNNYYFNWAGLVANQDTYFNASFEVVSTVPEPGPASIMGLGLIGLFGLRAVRRTYLNT